MFTGSLQRITCVPLHGEKIKWLDVRSIGSAVIPHYGEIIAADVLYDPS